VPVGDWISAVETIENWSFANARSAVECGTAVPLCRDMRQSGLPAACLWLEMTIDKFSMTNSQLNGPKSQSASSPTGVAQQSEMNPFLTRWATAKGRARLGIAP
jgi:hypothetical protein